MLEEVNHRITKFLFIKKLYCYLFIYHYLFYINKDMSGLLVGMCICCCICCIIYIGSCGYLLFMSESCSDINMYCDNQFAGDTAKVFKCKTYSNRINGILSTDVEKQMSDNEKKTNP